jgi:hypothetical protein
MQFSGAANFRVMETRKPAAGSGVNVVAQGHAAAQKDLPPIGCRFATWVIRAPISRAWQRRSAAWTATATFHRYVMA